MSISKATTLFSTTLTALAEDARTVRQLTSLEHSDKSTHDLEDLVSSLQDKLTTLHSILLEEQTAIQQFEDLQEPTLQLENQLNHLQQTPTPRRVTPQELTGRRWSHHLVNEALQEIHEWQARKQATRPRAKDARTREYLWQRRETASSWSSDVLTEQELREHCAFFRHGEATARALLGLLCSLHRLKQVQGGNKGVQYLLMDS